MASQPGARNLLEIFKSCLLCLVGISLMAFAEWLSFDKEQRKREFFERQERIEDVQDRLHERLERARASRPPLDFDAIWNDYERSVEESRRRREAGVAPTSSAGR